MNALGRLAALMLSQAVSSAAHRLHAAQTAAAAKPDAGWLWNDYLARPVVYNGLLIEVAGLAPDQDASRGFLPSDVAQRIHEYELDLSFMKASLRGYQAFGAKFALVQERAILGDEMGLGKTIQALAAMCHLAAGGARHFLLEIVAATLGPKAVGPLTGSVTPSMRQAMVDEFAARQGPAVLVSQVRAGGVGLNIQAASVVILAEPQLTPTAEEQAIARCHRMGQVRRVDVHRILTTNSVDQRMLELLHGKRVVFDEYARRSDLADISPDAVDVSDLAATKAAASEAEAERRTKEIIEKEQRRLRQEATARDAS